MGTFDQGIYKSTNGGASWTACNVGLGNLSVWAVAIDPASSGVVYAGTNGGVYKSTNAGASWSLSGAVGKTYTLAVDPVNSQHIFAGTDGGGVHYTMNGGTSWAAWNEGLGNFFVQAVTVDSATCSTVLAGTNSGIWERRTP